MSRSQRARRKQWIVVCICFVLAMAPLAYTAAASNRYPSGAFGGGGGDAFARSLTPNAHTIGAFQCGPWCGGFIGYLIGKAIDYATEKYNEWWNGGQPSGSNFSGGAVGGGGGDTFYIEHK